VRILVGHGVRALRSHRGRRSLPKVGSGEAKVDVLAKLGVASAELHSPFGQASLAGIYPTTTSFPHPFFQMRCELMANDEVVAAMGWPPISDQP
jgi:hypothetical protein